VRFYGLGTESVWLDEATSVFLARMDLPTLIQWTGADIHPPLYYILLKVGLIFGQDEAAIRYLSALAGTLTVLALYGLGRTVFDRSTALVGALLLALSPLNLVYSQQARMYALATLWGALSSHLLLLAVRRQNRWLWSGYTVAAILGLYTHYYTAFILLVHNLYIAEMWRRRSLTGPLWQTWWLVQASIALLFLPWLPVAVAQVRGGGGAWVAHSIGVPSPRALADAVMTYIVGPEGRSYPTELRRLAYLLSGLTLTAAVLRWDWKRRRPCLPPQREWAALSFCGLYAFLPLALAWLLSQVKPMFALRYLSLFLPPFCLLIARGITVLWDSRTRQFGKIVGTWLLLGLLITSAVGFKLMATQEQNPDWRSASAYILARNRPGDVVIFVPGWNFKAFDFYAHWAMPYLTDLPVPITAGDVEAILAQTETRYQRLWLIWDPTHYTDPEGQVQTLLDNRYRLLDRQTFRGVGQVSLYLRAAEP